MFLETLSYEQVPLTEFTEKAYLDYSMYVILDRALPSITDGLKPVQRRIIYAMSQLGLNAHAQHKKSARTVGDVLGLYHPHGDQACYEAMVLMAQPFSYRYPLIDGQGNWGSPDDPKSFAAMRYTESRLTSYAHILLSELEQGTVLWTPNYDGTKEEPDFLPSRLPNLLLNGATGIAVGMSTDIPPHNMREVIEGCITLLDDPSTSLDALCESIRGPDFTTEAELITPREELLRMYSTGHGSVRLRARWEIEEDQVVITALPHQVSGDTVLQQIASQMQARKLPMVEDLRDESDHENPTRLVITLRGRRVEIEPLMLHLCATTDLEKQYRINLNTIGLDGKPSVKDLRTLLLEWIGFRVDTVRRRLEYRLKKISARTHILEGLLTAFFHLKKVMALIREEEDPARLLMQRFHLSEMQTEAILELKLRQLAALEERKLRDEQNRLIEESTYLETTLASPEKLHALIKKEWIEDANRYGDNRRSHIAMRKAAQSLDTTLVVSNEPVTVILSEKGWVRVAKGHEIDPVGLTYRSGDRFLMSALGRNNQLACFIDSTGRSYTVPVHELPSARTQGEPLTGRLSPPTGAVFKAVVIGEEEHTYLFSTNAGYGFLTYLKELYTKKRIGKPLLTVPPLSEILPTQRIFSLEEDKLAIVTKQGRLLVIPVKGIPILGKGKGNKLIQILAEEFIQKKDSVVTLAVLPGDATMKLRCGKRFLTLSPKDILHYEGKRGRRGALLPRGFQRVEIIEIEK